MYRFTGFTEKANNAMNRAIEKAEELGHNYIGSEHVLYGLIAEGSGVAFNVLNKLGITADDYERVVRPTAGKRGRADAQEHSDAAQNTAEGAFSACGADGAGNVLPRDVRRSRDDYRQSEEGQNHAAVLLGGGAGAGL